MRFTGLEPDTTYAYRITVVAGDGATAIGSLTGYFKTESR